ncbi:MAG TPA: 3'-5' exonuclease [Acholeplasma sp.]|mgnify:CR=1 FL=1|jgi:DNA polymerase III epsilon subunit family exonuclease|nr:3'-5' exonuclease [Acholeplasma sp.]
MTTYKKALIFDFETTGLSAYNDQIIEIGALSLNLVDGRFQIQDELSCLVKASKPLPPKITEITNITDEMLAKEGITEEEAYKQLKKMYDEDTLLIAYNIQFDLGFLKALFRKFENPSFVILNDILDIMAVYKDRHKYPHRLENAVETYGVEMKSTHRALDDVKATYAVLKALQQEKSNIYHYVNKIGYNAKYGVSGERLPHVKYIAQYGGRLEIENS